MPSSPASSVKSAAPTTTAARWAAGAGSWPRLLALQILQVTSLSITFSLAYDFSAIPLNGTPLGSPRLAGSLHDFHAPEPSSAGPAGSVKWARKKKARAASAKLPPHQLSQASAGGQASDTDLEDPDDGLDGEEEEAIERSVPSVAARGGHVHYPLYQRGSELLGSSPVDLGESSAGPSCSGSRPHFATLLSKGLAVTVNGSPWRSVAAHVIEGEDEAVVVIYGLGPGREYVVELGLVGDEDGRFADLTIDASTSAAMSRTNSFSTSQPSSATTSGVGAAGVSAQSTAVASLVGTSAVRSRSRANSLRSRSRANSSSSNVNGLPAPAMAQALASSATAVAASVAGPALAAARPPPTLASPTAKAPNATANKSSMPTSPDGLYALLDRQLVESQAHAAHLAGELKSHRRTSQKAEAALRANISALQKAAEKNAAGDLRARQKALALGESVKRLVGGKDDVELEREMLEAEVAGSTSGGESGLEAREKERESEWDALRQEAAEVERERDDIVGANERLLGEWETELAALVGKLDKLNTKHDRLTTQILTYNERLDAIAKEKADIASGAHPILRDVVYAQGSSTGSAVRGGGEHGGQHARGRPASQARASAPQGGSNARSGQWKASSATSRGGPTIAFAGADAALQPGASTSPLQISAVPFRPLNHAGPYQYHRSSPSFTVQNPHAPSSSSAGSMGVNSHAHNAQSSFLAANAHADPYTAVFADRDDPAPVEPAAFPPLPSATAVHANSPVLQESVSPSLALGSQITPGSYSHAAVAPSTVKSSAGFPHAYQPPSRPSYASFSSASPQSSPALAHAYVVGRQQPFASAESAFPPLSPAGSLGTPSRKGSLQGTPATSTGGKGTPDPAERAAHIPLPLSPTFDRD